MSNRARGPVIPRMRHTTFRSRTRTLGSSVRPVLDQLERRWFLSAGDLDASFSGDGKNVRHFAVARLTTVGALDTSFSGDGRTTVDFGINADAQAIAIDGSLIYVGGYKDLGTTGHFALVRLLSSGLEDTSYSGDGE